MKTTHILTAFISLTTTVSALTISRLTTPNLPNAATAKLDKRISWNCMDCILDIGPATLECLLAAAMEGLNPLADEVCGVQLSELGWPCMQCIYSLMPDATLASVRASNAPPKLKWPNPDGVAACETNNVCKAAWDKQVGKPAAVGPAATSSAAGSIMTDVVGEKGKKVVPAQSGDLGGTAAGVGTS